MSKRKIRSEEAPAYEVSAAAPPTPPNDDIVIDMAKAILYKRLKTNGPVFSSPQTVKDYLVFQLAQLEHEVFACLFLDNQHALIRYDEMFRGTIDGASVYPREIVKRALQLNAAAVIFAHNHPSGTTDPSKADENLTSRLKAALGTVDIRTLDHIIVGKGNTMSFAERGMI